LLYARAVRITSFGLLSAALSLSACAPGNERHGGRAAAGEGGLGASAGADGTAGDVNAPGEAGTRDALGDADSGVAMTQGRRSFELVATLTPQDPRAPAASQVPASSAFTLVLEPESHQTAVGEAHQGIVGGGGRASFVEVTTTDAKTFSISRFQTGVVTGDPCMPVREIDFSRLEITISGSTVHGTAEGTVTGTVLDTYAYPGFTAEVTGAVDITPPVLFESSRFAPSSFSQVALVANEPLPLTATAWLTTAAGARIDLQPVTNEEQTLVVGFSGPGSVLPPADRFFVSQEGLVDFAGQRGTESVELLGFFNPPLVTEDGFESATGPQLGGAAIVTGVGALKPITGSHSLYFGASGAPVPPESSFTPALNLRLAAKPGATKLRFSYRTVSTTSGHGASVRVGSVGHSSTSTQNSIYANGEGTKVTWENGGTVTLGPVTMLDVALPADVTDEVVVGFDTRAIVCGGFGPPQQSGVLIDDLRLE
jgi:hypothetical protein